MHHTRLRHQHTRIGHNGGPTRIASPTDDSRQRFRYIGRLQRRHRHTSLTTRNVTRGRATVAANLMARNSGHITTILLRPRHLFSDNNQKRGLHTNNFSPFGRHLLQRAGIRASSFKTGLFSRNTHHFVRQHTVKRQYQHVRVNTRFTMMKLRRVFPYIDLLLIQHQQLVARRISIRQTLTLLTSNFRLFTRLLSTRRHHERQTRTTDITHNGSRHKVNHTNREHLSGQRLSPRRIGGTHV